MTQRRSRIVYVNAQAGWRALMLCLLIAAILGLGFRLYFSPDRLKSWVTTALDQQKRQMSHPFALSFSDASLKLSQGYLPQLAVVVTDVRVAPNPECHPESSVFIGELRLPFRVFSLLRGRAAVGVIGARDIKIDLDGLRVKCEPLVSPPHAAPAPKAPKAVVKLAAPPSPPVTEPVKPWWTDEQFDTVRGFVEGLEFSHATLQFENGAKEIYLDSFSALFKRGGLVQLKTEIRIPPPVTYGEQIPPLKIEGEALSTKANLLVSAQVSEGSLATTAILAPATNQTLVIDAKMSVKSLPLSMLSPFMRKAGLANERFQPKFLWLNCAASISGPFQGLFQKSPFRLEACRIEGDGTDVELVSAERTPGGQWQPFDVKVVSLDLAKLFGTVGVHGPDGVANDFGKLAGDIHVESPQEAMFTGELRNANISFSNRKFRSAQKIESVAIKMSIVKGRTRGEFNNFSLTNGALSGAVAFDFDRSLRDGTVVADILKLEFDPSVQDVLVGGKLGAIEGSAHLKFENSLVTDFGSKLKIDQTTAQDFAFSRAQIVVDRKGDASPRIVVDAPDLGLKKSSMLDKALEPVFFGHQFLAGDMLMFDQPHIEIVILESGDINWTEAKATLEHSQIQIASVGSMNRDHLIDGTLEVNYPKIKKLKWLLAGPIVAPTLQGTGESLAQMKARAEINDAVLGLRTNQEKLPK
jgi:hypothetical protein